MNLIDTTVVLVADTTVFSLENILHAYNNQTYRLFDVFILKNEFILDQELEIIKNLEKELFYKISFSEAETIDITNFSNYLIISDINLLVDSHYVEVHVKNREEGYSFSGNTTNNVSSQNILLENVYTESIFAKNSSTEIDKNKERFHFISFWKKEFYNFESLFKKPFLEEIISELKKTIIKMKSLKNKLRCLKISA